MKRASLDDMLSGKKSSISNELKVNISLRLLSSESKACCYWISILILKLILCCIFSIVYCLINQSILVGIRVIWTILYNLPFVRWFSH